MLTKEEIANDLISIRENINDVINQQVSDMEKIVDSINLIVRSLRPDPQSCEPIIISQDEFEILLDIRNRAKDLNNENRRPY